MNKNGIKKLLSMYKQLKVMEVGGGACSGAFH